MRNHLATLAVAGVAAALVAAPAAAARETGEARLAQIIADRSPGQPQRCITTYGNQRMTVIDKTAIVYRTGGRVWVNRTANPEDIDDDDIQVIRRFGSSNLCREDVVRLVDRVSGIHTGVLFLTDFVPYEKED